MSDEGDGPARVFEGYPVWVEALPSAPVYADPEFADRLRVAPGAAAPGDGEVALLSLVVVDASVVGVPLPMYSAEEEQASRAVGRGKRRSLRQDRRAAPEESAA